MILLIIVINSVFIIIDKNDLDNLFIAFYLLEFILKVSAFRLNYFKDGWNLLDFLITFFTVFPLIAGNSLVNISGLRGIKILRPLRTITTVKELRVIMETLF